MPKRGMPKRVLVTGGTRGIGKELVREFARAGFDVAFTRRTLHEGDGREQDGATDPEAARYNGQHFMAQEFVRQRGLWPEWETTLPMNPNWSPTAILDWREWRRR